MPILFENSKFLLVETDGTDDFGIKSKKIPLELDIYDRPVSLTIAVQDCQARLCDIVGLARQICQKITSIVLDHVEDCGYGVPCDKGCSACCSYLVPLSLPEVFQLKEEIGQRPVEQQRIILRSCLLASRNLLGKMPPKLFLSRRCSDKTIDTKMVANWYAGLKQACPFLYKSQCMIYDVRPIACREYYIKGSSRACKLGRGKAEVIQIPISMVEVLGQLASRLEHSAVDAIMLPLAPAWCQENTDRADHSWSAEKMARCFVEIIEHKALNSKTAKLCNSTV